MLQFKASDHIQYFDEIIGKHIKARGIAGELLIILIGNNEASLKYIGVKSRLCGALGIPIKFAGIDETLPDEKIVPQVSKLFADEKVTGGIVQLPVPRESLKKIFKIIPPEKDIDLISSINVARFAEGDFSRLTPIVRAAAYFLLNAYSGRLSTISIEKSLPLLREKLHGKNGFIVGSGFLVGTPIAQLLSAMNVSLQIAQKYHTGDKIYSDFAIFGTGKPNLVDGRDISSGCHVLDFGTGVLDGKITGDLNRNSQCEHLGCVSFSPGGIGPIVVRFLLMNFLGI